jgi:erythromycin esterase-like protein
MTEPALEELRACVQPLTGTDDDLTSLIAQIGDARYVLLGEATHGTDEFYALRARLTKRLVAERGFDTVAVEADWPDAYRVHRFARGQGDDRDALSALGSFERFPRWMWRNRRVVEFVTWLRGHNERTARGVGFYGIDLYSLHASIHAVLAYLEQQDPEGARHARERYGCFDSFGGDPERYAYATSFGLPSCEEAVIAQLLALREQRAAKHAVDGLSSGEEHFFAEQNARVVKNAERYYRAMYHGGISSWNLRDTHMADTVDALCAHVTAREGSGKIIVWAHNSHLGDARATELGEQGELNLGQLMRERHPGETFLLGFSTYHGEVTAASDWDEPPQRKRVRPALRDSYEALFHALELPSFALPLQNARVRRLLDAPRLQRAIGVVYRPDTERASHYYHARLGEQYDCLVHIDRTQALEPLEGDALVDEELPETYPTGL